MLNIGAITEVVHSHYATMVLSEHGAPGVAVFRKLLVFIKEVYTYVDPETQTGELVIFKALDDSQAVMARSGATEIHSVGDLAQYIAGDCVIEILSSGRMLVWHKSCDPKTIAQQAVVYSYKQRTEFFHAGTKSAEVEKVVIGCASSFAVPTFDDLNDALLRYRSDMIRQSSCPIFNEVWFDGDRLFFKTKQEKTMRNSLSYYLKARLRGVEVRPEQIVDSSHPVDIKVSWFLSNRLALIEIKWLGKARTKTKISSEFSAARALEGASQLADYLDKNKVQAPTHKTRGYLVIIDGRRAKTKKQTKQINLADGNKYANMEIIYKPKYHDDRTDFEVPIRMFAEPICRA